MQPEIVQSDVTEPGARDAINRGLAQFNLQHFGAADFRLLSVLLKEPGSDAVVGGLLGRTAWRWLFVELLFVPEPIRKSGFGRELMRRAEAEALLRGCHGAWVDTFSLQARGFYERLGYSVFGQLADCPPGHSRFFLHKPLAPIDEPTR